MARGLHFTSQTASTVMTAIISILGIGAIAGFTTILIKRSQALPMSKKRVEPMKNIVKQRPEPSTPAHTASNKPIA